MMMMITEAEIGSNHHFVFMTMKLCGRTLFSKVEKQSKLGTERLMTSGGKLKAQPFQSRVLTRVAQHHVVRSKSCRFSARVLGETDYRNNQI